MSPDNVTRPAQSAPFTLSASADCCGIFLAQAARLGLEVIALRLQLFALRLQVRVLGLQRLVFLLQPVDALHESLKLFADLRQVVRAGSLGAGGHL